MSGVHGRNIILSIFGESHGPSVGVVITGLPSGMAVDMERISAEMARRRPGNGPFSTPRKESDIPVVESGVYQGKTTGTPLCVRIPSRGQHSADYDRTALLPRPGHGDYTGYIKYKGMNDPHGGGHFSGRITAPLVFAGALAAAWLEEWGVTIGSHLRRIGAAEDVPFQETGEPKERLEALRKETLPVLHEEARKAMEEEILSARKEGDSVGGIVETMAVGLPAGVGDPFFDSVESRLAHVLFSIPAVKGVEFGAGFALSSLRGSAANDPFRTDGKRIWTETNHCGGVLGGITDGMPLLFRTALKPTPSIFKEQKTVDMVNMTNETLRIKGRHDPCIVPRALPVVEAVTAWILMDMMMDME